MRGGSILVLLLGLQFTLSGCGGSGGSNGGGGGATQTYTIGGTVSGLTNGGLALVDNSTDVLLIKADGSFTFSRPITAGRTYQVRIAAEPFAGPQLCQVTNGTGEALADVTSVEVACSTPSGQVLYSFGQAPDGNNPTGTLVFDNAGNLYGTTSQGGANGYGTVFELTPSQGQWTETDLYSFCAQNLTCPDGATPSGNLVIDAAGNLYGTTLTGGAYSSEVGSGVVFKLTRQTGATWSETVLHSFGGSGDGAGPNGLVFDSAGSLFGTAGGGIVYGPVCPGGCGVVFELTPTGNGQWTEQVLYSFCSQNQCTDGGQPSGGVVLDSSGNLYGTTAQGGTTLGSGNGTVFELTPSGNGQWTETVLYEFQGGATDGQYPLGGVVLDQAGNLYGTTEHGGETGDEGNNGTVFMLTRGTGGSWTESIIFLFCSDPGCAAGGDPLSGLAIDKAGNLYGTTVDVGQNKSGGVFALVPGPPNQVWNPVTLYGYGTASALILDTNGNVYGTVGTGMGANGLGEVFKITP